MATLTRATLDMFGAPRPLRVPRLPRTRTWPKVGGTGGPVGAFHAPNLEVAGLRGTRGPVGASHAPNMEVAGGWGHRGPGGGLPCPEHGGGWRLGAPGALWGPPMPRTWRWLEVGGTSGPVGASHAPNMEVAGCG